MRPSCVGDALAQRPLGTVVRGARSSRTGTPTAGRPVPCPARGSRWWGVDAPSALHCIPRPTDAILRGHGRAGDHASVTCTLPGSWVDAAPRTVAVISLLLPLRSRLIHFAGAGGLLDPVRRRAFLDLRPRTRPATRRRAEIIVYPGGMSECEILVAYGSVDFSSKVGQLWGNHFATMTTGRRPASRDGPAGAVEGRPADRASRSSGSRRGQAPMPRRRRARTS